MMEALNSSETPVLTGTTWHIISKDGILHSHCHEYLRSYIMVRRSEGRKPLLGPRLGWVDYIKMNLWRDRIG
jgi:hypothetical protein